MQLLNTRSTSYSFPSVTFMIANPDKNVGVCGKVCKLRETSMKPLMRRSEHLLT